MNSIDFSVTEIYFPKFILNDHTPKIQRIGKISLRIPEGEE
jgi:hypothetical protein